MDCPLCKVNLQMADRQGVEIDYCPKCRGIWLDRGELEKLIDLSVAQSTATQPPPNRSDYDERHDPYTDRRDIYTDRRDESSYRHGKPRKRESWLGNLLDFD